MKILILLLAGALVMFILDEHCIIDWYPSTCKVDTVFLKDTSANSFLHCLDDQRYLDADDTSSGGRAVSQNDAHASIDLFKSSFEDMINNSGVIVSKNTIDEMFNHSRMTNALVCYFSYDNAEKKVQLIFEPVIKRNNECQSPSANTLNADNNFYITEGYCPNWCGILSE